MSNDLTRFHQQADQTLGHVLDVVDDLLGDQIDADLHGDILTLTFSGGAQFILNKNAHLLQMWLSSPESGAWHFEWRDGAWISTRGGGEALEALLAAELAARTGRPVRF
ncbi:protein CyaY [mine drainage metagenome]|uniref:Protein CyaY n=1 Tax=mine drainage metagenome TaxID=410659 RepID=A0A1J5T8I3_9ZZZZ